MKISIIIPIYNEAENIETLYKRLKKVIIKDFKAYLHEIIFVDDGSQDNSFKILRKISKKDKNIKAIKFSRNFGHHTAIKAGIDLANSDFVFIMDADLQDPPEEMINIFTRLRKGYDLVFGLRTNTRDSFFKEITSMIFWGLINKMTGMKITPNQSMMRVFNKNVLQALKNINEPNLFYAGLFTWIGFNQTHFPIKNQKRNAGKSKYSISKMISLSLNAILGYSNLPLYYISYAGLFIIFASLISSMVNLIYSFINSRSLITIESIFILITFIGGIIIFSIGLLGLYISRIHSASLYRPLYIIKEKIK